MFATADEARDHYDALIADKQRDVEECDIALSSLNSAYEYLELVINEQETGDLLPSASSYEIDLFDRQMMISDRIGEREDMRLRAELAVEDFEFERDAVVSDLEQREDEADESDEIGAGDGGAEVVEPDDDEGRQQAEAAAYFDEVFGPIDNSGVEIISEAEDGRQELWARYVDNVLGPVDNSGIEFVDDDGL